MYMLIYARPGDERPPRILVDCASHSQDSLVARLITVNAMICTRLVFTADRIIRIPGVDQPSFGAILRLIRSLLGTKQCAARMN
jgi:hypothetical protein